MKIYTKQIDEASLTAFVTGAAGASFSGQLTSYVGANGYFGPNLVYTTGGSQIISGTKIFDNSPIVPYSGGTGAAPSRLYVDNQIIVSQVNLSGQISGISGILSQQFSSIKVTGSNTISNGNFSGIGGTQVIKSGNFILISGGAGGGSSTAIGNFVHLTGNESISGTKTFVDSVPLILSSLFGVPPTLSNAIGTDDILLLSGVLANMVGGGHDDGINLSGKLFLTGANLSSVRVTGSSNIQTPNLSGVGGLVVSQSGNFVLFSGGGGGTNINTINTINFTGTGTMQNTFTSSGSMTTTINNYSGTVNNNPIQLNGVTGNFVNMSYYFDDYNLQTGLNLIETFVGRDFYFTGYAIGTINSGTHGLFTGSFYQRNTSNAKTTVVDFSMQSGQFFTGRGGFLQIISGMHRVGVSIYNVCTGMTGVTVGLFGVGY